MNHFGIMDAYPSPCQWDEILGTSSYKELLATSYYPSPEVSPCMNDSCYTGTAPLVSSSLSPPESLYSYTGPVNVMMPATTNEMMMVPPLQELEMEMELTLPPLDLLDQFIQHHEHILSSSKYYYPSNIPTVAPSPKTPSPKSTKKVTARSSSIRQKRSHTSKKDANSKKNLPIQYNCQHPGCGKTFNRPYNLQSHMRTHTTDRPFGCTNCGRRFARQHDRNRHEKLHWGIKPYSCSQCHKSFARMDALNRHLKVENGCGVNGNDGAQQSALSHQVMV